MQKRSDDRLPAVYADTTSSWDIAGGGPAAPYALDVFDVTYLHFHNTLELGLCVDGHGVCYVENQAYPFGPGDAQIIFPFQKHLSKNSGTNSSHWYWVNLDPLSVLSQGGFLDTQTLSHCLLREMGICGILRAAQFPAAHELIRILIETSFSLRKERLHKELYFSTTLLQLILELSNLSAPLQKLTLQHDNSLLSVSPALAQIKKDLSEGNPTAVEPLALLCGMSPANFRRVFRKAIGLAPKDYILACCMRKARTLLLATNLSVLSIAFAVGFQNVSSFNRVFLAHNQMSPSTFRLKFKAESTSCPEPAL